MKRFFYVGFLTFLVISAIAFLTQTASVQTNSANQLAGLWEAKKRFGPDVRGALYLRQIGGEWKAEIAGRSATAKISGDAVSFELADAKGKFNGNFDKQRAKISGIWVQERTLNGGTEFAQPLTLAKVGRDIWRGTVVPYEDEFTFYLMIKPRDDGSLGAFMRNPERNLGWFQIRIDRLEVDGEKVKFFAADKGNEKGRMLSEGVYDKDADSFSAYFAGRGGTYNFRRVPAEETSNFYPRGRASVPYVYSPPPALDDGWQTASLEDAGFSRAAIQKFIQMIIDTPMDSNRAQEDHGVLIARHGKLVLEEYFHGENRDKPHETRSASKSVAADMIGAAIYSGIPIGTNDLVYQIMNNGRLPADLEPRKRAMTLEHLLTMSNGLDCDDGNPDSPGFEDRMWEQTEDPTFYKWTMALKMVRAPGEKGVYCSASPNLAGGILGRVAKQPPQFLFHKLLAEPLQMQRFYLPLSPAGDASFTGGAKFLPREFMKLGQVHLNGGTWNGRRIFTTEWSRRSTSPQSTIGESKYGYLWWIKDYSYKDRTVRAYYASGNGGQIVMAIPDLDLVMAFYAGSYNDVGGRKATDVYVPQYVLPAVEK